MTPHADLVARLLRELVTLVRGECPALLNEDSGGDARLSLAIDDALAALPPPADPPEPWGHPDLIEGLDMAAVILREVGATESAEHCDTAARLLTSGPADPPALVALVRELQEADRLRRQGERAARADHPGDTVTLTTSWDSIVVPDAQIAAWLNANPWAVRYRLPCGRI